MNSILNAAGIGKKYGKKIVLDGIHLSLGTGQIMGLLGPNGSGKTTFLKIAAGLLKSDSGKLTIDGVEPGLETKRLVTFVPDRNTLYNWMTVEDAVAYYKDFHLDFDVERCRQLLQLLSLEASSAIKALSKGMQEKLVLALAFSRKSKLYILDEPFVGIDVVSREQIINLIVSNFREDCSILLTTHLIRDIESLFDRVAFIDNGKIIMEGNSEDIRNERGISIEDLYKEAFGHHA